MEVFVIHERHDDEDYIIGVSDSVEKADLLIEEYYGAGNYKEVYFNQIGEGGLEYVKTLEVKSEKENPYNVTITLLYFTVNSL